MVKYLTTLLRPLLHRCRRGKYTQQKLCLTLEIGSVFHLLFSYQKEYRQRDARIKQITIFFRKLRKDKDCSIPLFLEYFLREKLSCQCN